MIAKSAIRQFLNRELDTFNWMKKIPLRELKEELEYLPAEMDFKTNPRKAQLVCFLIGTAFDGFNFHLDMGVGKAQPLDRRILTPSGYKLMGELEVGDLISHPSGGTTRVEKIHPQGDIPVFEVMLSDGSVTQCCREHLWTLAHNRDGSNRETLDLDALIDGIQDVEPDVPLYVPLTQPLHLSGSPYPDFVSLERLASYLGCDPMELIAIAKNVPCRHDFVHDPVYSCNDIVTFIKETSDPEIQKIASKFPAISTINNAVSYRLDAYSLGCILGTGNLSQALPTVTLKDPDCIKAFETGLGGEYSVVHGISNQLTVEYSGNRFSPLTRLLHHLELRSVQDSNKFIPNCYKFGSLDARLSLAQGLLDSAGTFSRAGTADFMHTSKRLRDDLAFVLQTLGCVTRCEDWRRRGVEYYYLVVIPPKEAVLTRSVATLNQIEPNKFNQPSRKIEKIVSVGKKLCQCITVSAPDGLYITDDCIVTHNTKLTLDLLTWYKKINKIKRGLVVVPNTGNAEGWREEVEIHSNLSMSALIGTPNKRFKALAEDTDVCVINYHGLMTMMTQLKPQKDGKRKRVADRKMVHEFVSHFDFVAFDEIHKAKNKDSLLTYLCELVATNCTYKYGLTGTPMKSPEDLWSQFFLVDGGETLSPDYDLFMATFFKKQQKAVGSEWVFNDRMRRVLTKMIQHRSIRYRDYECQDLPKTVTIRKPIILSKQAREAYLRIQNQALESEGDTREQQNCYIKFREITAGYTSVVDPETDEKIYIDFPENPKMEELVELVDQMPHDSKMLIFHQYKHTGTLISDTLREMKINHRCLNGSTKDKPKVIREFKEDKTIHVLVASETGTTGHNFQVANYTVFYETFTSPITRRQADKRTHRGDQKKTCFYYDLCAKNSVDERIFESLKQGIDLSKAILEGTAYNGLLKNG